MTTVTGTSVQMLCQIWFPQKRTTATYLHLPSSAHQFSSDHVKIKHSPLKCFFSDKLKWRQPRVSLASYLSLFTHRHHAAQHSGPIVTILFKNKHKNVKVNRFLLYLQVYVIFCSHTTPVYHLDGTIRVIKRWNGTSLQQQFTSFSLLRQYMIWW
jgi:hypothetical protein